jgi:hypothetical protein
MSRKNLRTYVGQLLAAELIFVLFHSILSIITGQMNFGDLVMDGAIAGLLTLVILRVRNTAFQWVAAIVLPFVYFAFSDTAERMVSLVG